MDSLNQSARTAENCSFALWVIAQDNFGLVHSNAFTCFPFLGAHCTSISELVTGSVSDSFEHVSKYSLRYFNRWLAKILQDWLSFKFVHFWGNVCLHQAFVIFIQFPCKACTCATFIIFFTRFAFKPDRQELDKYLCMDWKFHFSKISLTTWLNVIFPLKFVGPASIQILLLEPVMRKSSMFWMGKDDGEGSP